MDETQEIPEQEDKTIFRRRRSRFTAIGNAPLMDKTLGLDAVGFLTCIMALPQDWIFNRSWAKTRFSVGKEKLSKIINQLSAAGYVLRSQEREYGGRHGRATYVFTDEPGRFDDEDGEPEIPSKDGGPRPSPEVPPSAEPRRAENRRAAKQVTYKGLSLTKKDQIQNLPNPAREEPPVTLPPALERRSAAIGRAVAALAEAAPNTGERAGMLRRQQDPETREVLASVRADMLKRNQPVRDMAAAVKAELRKTAELMEAKLRGSAVKRFCPVVPFRQQEATR